MANVFNQQSTIELIMDKSSMMKTAKGISDSVSKAFKNVKFGAKVGSTQAQGVAQRAGAKAAGIMEKIKGGGDIKEKETTGGMGKMLGGILKAVGPIAIVAILLGEIFQFISPIFKLLSLTLLLFLIPVFKMFKPYLRDMPQKMSGIIKWLTGIFKGIMKFIVAFAQDPMGAILGGLTWIFDTIVGFFASVDWGKIVTMIINTLGSLISGGIGIISAIISALLGLDWGKIFNDISVAFGGLLKTGGDLFKTIIDNLPEPLKNAWDMVISAIETASKIVFGEDGKSGLWGNIANGLTATNKLIFGDGGEGGLWGLIADGIKNVRKLIFGEDGKSGLWLLIAEGIKSAATMMFGEDGKGGLWKKIIDGLSETGDKIYGSGGILEEFNNILDTVAVIIRKANEILTLITFGTMGNSAGNNTNNNSDTGTAGDFIYRPGQTPLKFNPSDTLVGIKSNLGLSNLGNGGGGNTTIINVSGFVDKESVKRVFEEITRNNRLDFQGRQSFVSNIKV